MDTSKVSDVLRQIEAFDLSDAEKDVLLFAYMLKRGLNEHFPSILDRAADRKSCNDRLNAAIQLVKGEKWGMCQHGMIQRLETRFSEAEKSEISGKLRSMSDLLRDKLGIDCFITSGTLLGLIREGKFLAHDFDFDMAYISRKMEKSAIAEERREVVDVINRSEHFRITNPFTDKVQVKFQIGGQEVYMDLFVAYRSGQFFNEVPLKPDTLPIDDVVPLKTMSLYGVDVFVPKFPEKLLEINYGPSWKVPDPSFRFNFGEHAAQYWFLHKTPISPT